MAMPVLSNGYRCIRSCPLTPVGCICTAQDSCCQCDLGDLWHTFASSRPCRLATTRHSRPVWKHFLDGLNVLQGCEAVATPLQWEVGCWCCLGLCANDKWLPGSAAGCLPVALLPARAEDSGTGWRRCQSAGRHGCAAVQAHNRHDDKLAICAAPKTEERSLCQP